MENFNDRYMMPFSVGSELSAESFRLAQYDNTYMLAPSRYFHYYASYVRPRILMYNGWIEGFHNIEYGVLPSLFLQKIGGGIINTLFSKPVVLNTEDMEARQIIETKYKRARFFSAVKEAYGFAEAGGAGLIKLNRDGNGELRYEAVPMNRFFVTTDAYGDIEKVKCFVSTYHDTVSASCEYYLCEERFFRYADIGGVRKRFPMAHYTFYRTSPNIAYESAPSPSAAITWKDIPHDVRVMIERDYGKLPIDAGDSDLLSERIRNARSDGERATVYSRCQLLPFDDDLGCRLVKFTDGIPAFPKLPFGQPLADLLMNEAYQYDQLKFFERTEVYIARGRVMVDEGQVNTNDPDARRKILDPMVFTFYDNVMGGDKDGKPIAIQPELRAEQIKAQKQNILNDAAFALNLSSSTIAAWLSDGTTQKTATEIEYERTKTDSFINEKTEIIREPLQELIDLYFHYYGVTSPQLNIVSECQVSHSDNVRLYSELYDKGQVTAKALAEKILGTCSVKEVNELAEYIEEQKSQIQAQPQTQLNPIDGGKFNVGLPK